MRWLSWDPVPNKPYGFCGRKATPQPTTQSSDRLICLLSIAADWPFKLYSLARPELYEESRTERPNLRLLVEAVFTHATYDQFA